MHSIDIYRDGSLLVTVKLEEGSTQNKTVMGENFVSMDFELPYYVPFKVSDQASIFGEIYKLNEQPVVRKLEQFKYSYSLKMLAEGADLAKVQYLFLDPVNNLTEPDFSLMGNAQTFLNLILQNANRILSGWSIGEVIPTDYKNLTFSNQSCLEALAKIAEAFSTEWWIIGKTIHLAKKTVDLGITFRHGRHKGLYSMERTNAGGIITRLYPFGGERNLPANYGSKKLRLTVLNSFSISNLTAIVVDNGDGTSTFTFNWTPASSPGVTALTVKYRLSGSSDPWISNTGSPTGPKSMVLNNGVYDFYFVTEPFGVSSQIVTIGSSTSSPLLTGFPQPYIENNVPLYGTIEHNEVFEDIYPRRTGVITAVDATDVYKFTDAAIDFDVNAQLLPGLAAKVVFNTGDLAGYQFDIGSFNNTTKEFRILKNKDETTLDIPSSLLKPSIGDKYKLVDITMPPSYVTAAENELLQKAQNLLLQISNPQYSYNIEIDPTFIKSKGYVLSIGDEVWITDNDLQVNRKIRITQTTRDLVEEDKYKVTVSDAVSPGTIAQINNSISAAGSAVNTLNNQFQNAAILNGKVIGDLVIEQGTFKMPDIPTTSTMVGFENIVREISTGKLFRKI